MVLAIGVRIPVPEKEKASLKTRFFFIRTLDKIRIFCVIYSNISGLPEEAKAVCQERLNEVQKMKDSFEEVKKYCQ